jgi:general stress protein 26
MQRMLTYDVAFALVCVATGLVREQQGVVMETTQREELAKLIASFDSGVLVAQDSLGDLRAHPVALGRMLPDGALWIAAGIDGTPVIDPERRDACMLICERGEKHLVLSGGVALELDPARAHVEWMDRWGTWFPDGPSALSLVLARFCARSAEYWDHTGHRPARYMLEMARSLVRGSRVPKSRDEHFHIPLT